MGSDAFLAFNRHIASVSIRAPRVGSDRFLTKHQKEIKMFQSALPVWGATQMACDGMKPISSFQSALPVWGATGNMTFFTNFSVSFNPRSPCGERLLMSAERDVMIAFQSALPVWGATRKEYQRLVDRGVSIRAPRVGSDSVRRLPHGRNGSFNPRSPCGERRRRRSLTLRRSQVSIRAPRVGSDGDEYHGVISQP